MVVIVDTMIIEVLVWRVIHENIVQNEQVVVVVVQTNHQIHTIQAMHVQIVVIGNVIPIISLIQHEMDAFRRKI